MMYVYPYRITPMLLHFLAYIGKPADSLQFRDVECGKSFIGHSRIVGGSSAASGEFPWMVSIQFRNEHYCGGALIANQWILTASHCLYSSRIRNNLKELSVQIGINNQDEMKPPTSSAVDKIILHPEFKTHNYINDIALLRLKEPIKISRFSLPVCLPQDEDELYIGREAMVTGWGWMSEKPRGGHKPNSMQKLAVKVIDNRMCSIWYKEANYPLHIQPVQLCAGYKEGGKDSCEGDSGGPLIIKEGNTYKVIGIVSSGLGCARPSLPGLYSRVTPFLRWINNYIQT
uniref:Peptidase S1 domain-containing protein n=1 Tax=Strigamia maritima TaxID=126957 RepID=T1IJ44_STRMM